MINLMEARQALSLEQAKLAGLTSEDQPFSDTVSLIDGLKEEIRLLESESTLAELIALNLKPEYLFQHCLDTATDYCDEVGDTYLFMFNDGSKLRTVRNGTLTEVVE